MGNRPRFVLQKPPQFAKRHSIHGMSGSLEHSQFVAKGRFDLFISVESFTLAGGDLQKIENEDDKQNKQCDINIYLKAGFEPLVDHVGKYTLAQARNIRIPLSNSGFPDCLKIGTDAQSLTITEIKLIPKEVNLDLKRYE